MQDIKATPDTKSPSDLKGSSDSRLSALRWIEEPSQPILRPPSEEFDLLEQKSFSNTFLKKAKENIFVPIGLVATTACLTMGLINMRKGNSAKQQMFMRGRIGFQFFTLVAMVVGVSLSAKQRKNKTS